MRKIYSLLSILLLLAGCNNQSPEKLNSADADSSKEKKEANNKQVVLSYSEAWNAHNADKVIGYIAPDFIGYGSAETPQIRGADSLKAVISDYWNSVPDVRSKVLEIVADSNIVMMYMEISGTERPDAESQDGSGKPFRLKGVGVWKVNDQGKIYELKEAFEIMPEEGKD